LAVESVTLITREARTPEAAQCVGAVREHVTRTILAFVLICNNDAIQFKVRSNLQSKREQKDKGYPLTRHLTTATSVAIVAVTLGV